MKKKTYCEFFFVCSLNNSDEIPPPPPKKKPRTSIKKIETKGDGNITKFRFKREENAKTGQVGLFGLFSKKLKSQKILRNRISSPNFRAAAVLPKMLLVHLFLHSKPHICPSENETKMNHFSMLRKVEVTFCRRKLFN